MRRRRIGKDGLSYQEIIFKSNIARTPTETFHDAVERYFDYMRFRAPQFDYDAPKDAVLAGELMPSTRALWSAGPALESESASAYHCAYVDVTDIYALPEMLYLLMCGCGVGISVEHVDALPPVPHTITRANITYTVEDSRAGWAKSLLANLTHLWRGELIRFDYSAVRPKGAPLKTFGGTASGPEPLRQLNEFVQHTFLASMGRKLTSTQIADIAGMISACVVCGGVRRSASICLSRYDDADMQTFKSSSAIVDHPHRCYMNVSATFDQRPPLHKFLDEWTALVRNGTGERGLVNKSAIRQRAISLGRPDTDYGLNPCGEIILQSRQMCNLVEVIVRPHHTLDHLCHLCELAGTLASAQATLLDFHFILPTWRHQMETDTIVGVSLTGLRDHPVLQRTSNEAIEWLTKMRQHAHKTAPFRAVTCVKPSGTTSQLADCSSGLHPRYAKHYVRRVRIAPSPLATELAEKMPHKWDGDLLVLEFEQWAPEGAVTADDVDVVEQLEYWKMLRTHWCDHNPSATIYVRTDDEWLKAVQWCWDNFDILGGITFLPWMDHVYTLAPLEALRDCEGACSLK